jgi:lipopolysaccharide export system permease protein
MKILDRYLALCFLRAWLSVNLVLGGLFSFLELVKQLDDIEGRYRLADALLYVALTLPGRMFELAAMGALLGAILGLGLLAKNLELVALRAGGISIQRIGWGFARPALLILVALLLGAQFIIPPLEQTAWTRRATALARPGTILPRGDFWTRHDRRFINLRTDRENGVQAVDLYEFDDKGRLAGYIHAGEARIGAEGNWELRDVQQRVIADQGGLSREMPQLIVPGLLTREQAAVLALPPQTLSLSELLSIIKSMKNRQENPGRYRLALWQKLTLPLMAAAMILMSLPFVCGPARSASLGWRMMIGTIIGVAFFFLNRILGYSGLILQISPAWTTLLPALAVLACGVFLTRKIG